MKKISFFCLLGVIFLFGCRKDTIQSTDSCTAPQEENPQHPKAARFKALIEEYAAKGLPGINLLVNDANGRWVGSTGMADIAKGVAMRPCHISKAASITKMTVATLAMMLVEDGKLSLDDPASKYVDAEIISNIENADKATLRMLLGHRTGIYEIIEDTKFYLELLNQPDRNWMAEDLLEFAYGKPALFPAGTSVSYSNTNTILVSLMIEGATGENHAKLLHERIFDKLGMKDTYYPWHDEMPEGDVAQGYYDLYNNGTLLNVTNYNTGSGNGYGGLFSTVYDLQVFIEALLKNRSLISDSSIKQMMDFHPLIENGKYVGVGIFEDFTELDTMRRGYGHRGRDLAYSADLFYFPNQQATLAIMVNYGTDGGSALRPVFLEFRRKLGELVTE